jgi:hypothetical protein
VIGLAWAANTIVHFGLMDLAILRYAKRKIYRTLKIVTAMIELGAGLALLCFPSTTAVLLVGSHGSAVPVCFRWVSHAGLREVTRRPV